MQKALVCINANFFEADNVLEKLKQCREVEEAFRVHGVYDVIAKIHGENTESLLDTVTRYIKRLPSVQTVHTMLIIEPEDMETEKRVVLA